MTRKHKKSPLLGESFNPEMMNMGDVFERTAAEINWYVPRKSWRIRSELKIAEDAFIRAGTEDELDNDCDAIQAGHDALNAAESLLSDWAQRLDANPYIYFTIEGCFAGFRINVDSAIEDADWLRSDRWNATDTTTPRQPGNGAGLEVFINDHGNVTAWQYGANGHKRELFSVV